MGYACDSDDGNAALLLITDLSGNADTLALCQVCLPAWIAVMHNELNGDAQVADIAPTDPTTGDETDDDQAADGAHHGTEPPTPPLPLDGETAQTETATADGAQSTVGAVSTAPGDTSGDSAPVAASG